MGRGSKFVPKKSLQPQVFDVVETDKVEVKNFHGLYRPEQGSERLITYAFSGAAGAIRYLGDADMSNVRGGNDAQPCLLRACFEDAGAWKIERVVNPGANEIIDVVANEVSSEHDVVRWMREWGKQANRLCDGRHDIQGFEARAKLVVEDSPLPPRL